MSTSLCQVTAPTSSPRGKRLWLTSAATASLLVALPTSVMSIAVPVFQVQFENQLQSLSVTGAPALLPLASDPSNALGDSVGGYGFVASTVAFTLSSQRPTNPGPATTGWTVATPWGTQPGPPVQEPDVIDLANWDGENFQVQSFFDVFFDITITDVDSSTGRDFFGQPNGGSLRFENVAAGRFTASYQAILDSGEPNFGLYPPPERSSFIGSDIILPLGGDVNGNGANDKIRFTLSGLAALDANRAFNVFSDPYRVDSFFDVFFQVDGLVADVTSDPPFTLGGLTGPTTGRSLLDNPILPEPSALTLLGLGALAALFRRRG